MPIKKIREMDLHITNRCNLKCTYCCYNSGSRILPEMSLRNLLDTVSAACDCGLQTLHVNGGEPLLREDLHQLLDYAINDKNLNVRLQTNGMLLSSERLTQLQDSGLKKILISLDGANPKTHEHLRGKGTFTGALQAIKNCLSAGMDVRVNSIATQDNSHELIEIAEAVFQLGVTYYSFYYFSPIGRGYKNSKLWIPEREWLSFSGPFLIRAKLLLKKYPGCDIFYEAGYATRNTIKELSRSTLKKCGAGCEKLSDQRDYIIIRCDGEAFPCILFVNEQSFLGNVLVNSFKEILKKSPSWDNLTGSLKREECSSCSLSSVCIYGCRGYMATMQTPIDMRCNKNSIAILCPIAKVSVKHDIYAGASDDIMKISENNNDNSRNN